MKKKKLFSGIMALTIAISSPAYASDISISMDGAQEIANDKSDASTESSEMPEVTEVTDASEVQDTEPATTATESEADSVFILDATEMPEESEDMEYISEDTSESTENIENTEAAAGESETDSEIEVVESTETEITEEVETTEDSESVLDADVAAGDDKFASEDSDIIYIGSEAELFAMADNSLADYELTADITITDDLTDYIVEYYEGCFNGNGHTITYTSSNSKCLFGSLTSTAEVKNLNVYAEITDDMDGAAMIASSSWGIIKNCTTDGNITTNSVASGIVVINNGSLLNCVNNADIFGEDAATSGISHTGSGCIKECTNYGKIEGKNAGGIAWANSEPTISCSNYGDILGQTLSGGIVSTSNDDVIDCKNYGNISSGNTNAYVGGITGESNGHATIQNCVNYGEINGIGSIGGICGTANITSGTSFDENDVLIVNAGNIVISNCENHGKVTGTPYATQNTNIGGIVGTADTLNGPISISSCTNYESVTGVVSSSSNCETSAGGIAGGIGCDDRGNGSGSVSLSNLTNYGNVKATYAAGIVRYFTGSESHPITVKNAINTGNIEGKWAHGIAGSFSNENRIEQCFNAGNVYGYEIAYGIGRAYAIANCYNLGFVKADSGNASGIGWGNKISLCYNAGAVVCKKAGSIAVLKDINESLCESSAESCYYLQEGLNESFGTGLTTSQMQIQNNFKGFDFNNVWTMRQQHGMLLPALSGIDTSFMDNLKYIENSSVSLSASNATYSGTAITPDVAVTYGKTKLVNGTDYLVVYRNNVNKGTATAVIVGQGNYSGMKTVTYSIGALSINSASVAPISDQTYSGQAITPAVTLKYNSVTLVKGTDYTISYSNNKNAGTATAVITGKGNYSGTIKTQFKICPLSIYSAYNTEISDQTYTGKAIEPKMDIIYGNTVLTKGTDYTVSYSDNKELGSAKVTVTGIGNFCDSWFFYFEIKECNIKKAKIGKIANQFYTGKAIKPSVSVKVGSTKLKKDQDYTVKYSNNKKAGTATVTISGIANYTGTAKTTFKIVDKVSNVKASSAGYNSIKLSWNKLSNATGYKIYRADKKDGKYKCIKTISDKGTITYTDKKLTINKNYYYKVAPYKSSTIGKKSRVVSAKPSLAKPKSVAATAKGSKTVNISWKKVSGASGYEVYRADSKKGTYKKVATIKKGSTVSYKNKKLKKGTTYYYKVRAYRTVGKKKVYSGYSSVVSAKAK